MNLRPMPRPAVTPPVATEPVDDLAAWVDRQQRGLWRYLRFLGCEAHRLDDLLQDAFLAAVQVGIPGRPAAVARAWLRTTARNLFLMELRAKRSSRVLELTDEAAIEAAWQHCAGAADDGDDYVGALRDCLGHAEPRARQALARFYGDGAQREVIAAEVGLGLEGVKTLLRRAKVALRDCIEHKLGER